MTDDNKTIRERNQEKVKRAAEASVRSRRQQKQLRAALREGKVDAFELVAGHLQPLEGFIENWNIERLLKIIPGLREDRRFEVIAAFGGSPGRKVGKLPSDQRELLADLVRQAKDPWGA